MEIKMAKKNSTTKVKSSSKGVKNRSLLDTPKEKPQKSPIKT